MVSRAKGHRTIHDTYLPFLLFLFRGELSNEFVDLDNGLFKSFEHVLWCDLQFVDEAVHFVDEENGLHLLLQCLADNRFGLRHGPFNGTGQDETSVNSTHGTSNVPTEVDVTGCVDQIDQVICPFHGVNHGCRGSVDGDAPSGFLFVKIQDACSASEFV